MSSTQEATSAATSCSKKPLGNRHSWTISEEATLLTALKELVGSGQKTPNGFRAGYLKTLEDSMREEHPKADIKGHPHITSKLSTWKKFYGSLCGITNRSGVGFNSRGTHMIDCEDDQWAQIVKVDPNARLIRYKKWPYFEQWKEIFGTDRATGEGVEDMFEVFTEISNGDHVPPEVGIDGEKEDVFENLMNDASNDRVSQSTRTDRPPQKWAKSKKKARFNDDIQGVCQVLADMNESTNERLDKLVSRIGFEYDMSKARQETFQQLGKIPGLSRADRFKVCELVTFKVERLDMWRGMEQDEREEYVEHLLEIIRG